MLTRAINHDVVTGRMPERQTAGIEFTHSPKIRFIARRGDSLHRFTSNLAWPTGTWVAWLCKISPQSAPKI